MTSITATVIITITIFISPFLSSRLRFLFSMFMGVIEMFIVTISAFLSLLLFLISSLFEMVFFAKISILFATLLMTGFFVSSLYYLQTKLMLFQLLYIVCVTLWNSSSWKNDPSFSDSPPS